MTVSSSEALGIRFVGLMFGPTSASANEQISQILLAWSRAEDRLNLDKDLQPSSDSPGYLQTHDDEGVTVFVPVNLVRVSPTRTQREAVHQLALNFRVQTRVDYCLSGSGTFMGVTDIVSDIDLAEYVYMSWSGVEASLNDMVPGCHGSDYRLHSLTIKHPSGRAKQKTEQQFPDISKCVEAAGNLGWTRIFLKGKGDLSSISLGEKDVTNMVFPARSRSDKSDSFVLQEIILTDEPDGRPYRTLSDRPHTAKYLNFLEKKARVFLDEYRISNNKGVLVKSLKRTLSLVLLMGDRIRFRDGLELLCIPRELRKVDAGTVESFIEDTLSVFLTYKTKAGAAYRSGKGT